MDWCKISKEPPEVDKLVILNEGKIIYDGVPEDALKEKDENITSLFKE